MFIAITILVLLTCLGIIMLFIGISINSSVLMQFSLIHLLVIGFFGWGMFGFTIPIQKKVIHPNYVVCFEGRNGFYVEANKYFYVEEELSKISSFNSSNVRIVEKYNLYNSLVDYEIIW